MIDYLIIAILLAVICGAAFYIYKAKKNGTKCIGCRMPKPAAATAAVACAIADISKKKNIQVPGTWMFLLFYRANGPSLHQHRLQPPGLGRCFLVVKAF